MKRYLFALALLAGCQEYNLASENKAEDPFEEPIEELTPAPDIIVDPMNLDFSFLPPDCPSDPQTVTVMNNGDADLEITNIILEGVDIDAYVVNGTPELLAPLESFEFEVRFMAEDYLLYDNAYVRVYSNDPDEPELDVSLEGEGADDAIFEDLFQQDVPGPVDVLWVVDNSGSMKGDLNALTNAFHVFINNFVNLGLDFQIGVVTTDMDDPTQQGKIQGDIIDINTPDPIDAFHAQVDQGSDGSGSERALDAAYAALETGSSASLIAPGNPNEGLVRQGSNLSIITVTDEDDSSTISANDFSNWLDAYQGDPLLSSFSAIAGPESQGLFTLPCISFSTGNMAEPVSKYPKVISQTGGIHANICDMDFLTILNFLSYASAGLSITFDLTHLPTDTSQIEVEIDGQTVPYSTTDGWSYLPGTNRVIFHGSWIPAPAANVVIRYPITTECPN
jgi:hypothetical protein